MKEDTSFGPSLRRERERSGASLQAIASTTKISTSLLAAMERNDFSRWPTGIFRRAFLRGYAAAIGLDPEVVVSDYLRSFPDEANVSIPSVKETVREPVATPASWDGTDERRPADVVNIRTRCLAALADTALLLTVGLVAAAIAGEAGFWPGVAIAAFLYYVPGTLVFGGTPSLWLIAEPSRIDRPVPSYFVSAQKPSIDDGSRKAATLPQQPGT
jgi:cytoskeletal protein RodZ